MNLNNCVLAGRLTHDPELSYTPKGTAVVKLGLAINRTWKTEAGEKKEEVTFLNLEAWGRTAEVIGQYFKKGREIYVEARAKVESWEDKVTKEKKSAVKFVVESFQFVGSEPKGQEAAPPARTETAGERINREAQQQNPAQDDTSVPF